MRLPNNRQATSTFDGWGEHPYTIITPSFTYRGFKRTTITISSNNVLDNRPPPNGFLVLGFDDRTYANGVLGRSPCACAANSDRASPAMRIAARVFPSLAALSAARFAFAAPSPPLELPVSTFFQKPTARAGWKALAPSTDAASDHRPTHTRPGNHPRCPG